MLSTSQFHLSSLYQAASLLPYSERLIHGFTGKPLSLGGPDTEHNLRDHIIENRQKLWDLLPGNKKEWVIPEQVHGVCVGKTGDVSFQQTDGILLLEPFQPVMLLFADCVPVLLYEPRYHAGAVLHAGWRGTSQNMAQAGIKALCHATGCEANDIVAVVGPAIDVCCFQVSLSVAQALAFSVKLTLSELASKGFLQWDSAFPENPRVNLKAINAYQLQQTGAQQIEILQPCTQCLPENLFSYRRGEDGRNSAFMMLL